MSARDSILKRLRQTTVVDVHPPQIDEHLDVVPVTDTNPLDLFIAEAEKLMATVQVVESDEHALQAIQHIIGDETRIMGWDTAHIPLEGLSDMLDDLDYVTEPDTSIRISLTGADAAIAATGSLVVCSGKGKARSASLTSYTHIAVISKSQILVNLEAWVAEQRQDNLQSFRQDANIVLISGASRTADIAMELVVGAHGPAELYVIVLP